MGMVSKLMENDELKNMISSLASSNADGAGEEKKSDEPPREEKSQSPDLSSLVNPEMMKMLPALLGTLGQSSNRSEGEKKSEGERKNDGGNDHRALLLALKPFLSDNRRRAVDMMLGMEKLSFLRDILPKER